MGSDTPTPRRAGAGPLRPAWRVVALSLSLSGLLAPATAPAQGTRNAAGIYSCVDAQGRKLTSDRPIPECLSREQRVLNRDGSVRQVMPPAQTPEERAERDARARQQALQQAAQADAVRRDRNLMLRYPSEAQHAKARQAALEPVRQAIKASEKRVLTLATERKRLDDEAEFYKGRSLPAQIRQQLDANDAAVAAQQAAARNQEAEMARIHALYDVELARLRRLWAGAEPGSLPAEPAAGTPAGMPTSAPSGAPARPPAKPAAKP